MTNERDIILLPFFMFAITGSTISIKSLEEDIFAASIYKMAHLGMGVLKASEKMILE